jgi:stage II sporulation SpoAA-like protein
MIKIEVISGNAVKIKAPEKLKADDFLQIAPQIDSLIKQHGQIRLLIDASEFSGWESIAAFENHARFIKSHQQRVERIAVIAAHDWQYWLIGAVRIFLHPEVRAYDKSDENEALQWIVGSAYGPPPRRFTYERSRLIGFPLAFALLTNDPGY